MYKKLKKLTAVALMGSMLFAMGGCGKKTAEVGEDGVKEMTMFLMMVPTAYSPDMPIWKEAENKTGIRIKSTVSQLSTDENTAYTTMIAGDKLPDLIRTSSSNLRKLARDGGLVPLDELIDKHAPNIKKFFEDCPEAKAAATVDNEIYFIPGSLSGIEQGASPSAAFFIRQDWLNKLGLEEPKTIEDFYNVLKAFKTQDPNGNGQADEIPFFDRFNTMGRLLPLFCTAESWVRSEDGTIEYGPSQENFKTAMKTLSQWYKEGLIDSEIYTRTNAREQLLGSNVGGSTCDWIASTSKFNETYAQTVPGLNFSVIMPPANINGKVVNTNARGLLHSFAWGISVDCPEENLVDAIKYYDFWMSEEGQDLMAFGVEGVSYNVVDGELVWTDEALSYESGVPNYLRSIGTTECGTIGNLKAEKSTLNETALKGFEAYEEITEAPIPSVIFTDEERTEYNKYITNINTYAAEYQQKFLLGKVDIDAVWDDYIKELKNMNLDKVTEIYNSAYKRTIGK